ncbi:BQ5605_C015g08006 [Microbotryum silenes-dioicae]|uniref:BQ5605_C015g08006 protein n=1 Tax=Microbotryum silenes-dioicae TaxID=796604 RepID=A0A2X0NXS6_9BASI|nr:BQ5605_C015g08006 [Microbotryum silenes-dioicae]
MQIRFERNPEHGCNEQDSDEEDEAEANSRHHISSFAFEQARLAWSSLDFFSAPPPLHPPREVILDLLDPYLYVKAGGASLLDQNHVEWAEPLTHPCSPPLIGPHSLIVPEETKWTVKAGHVFPLVVQCDADVVGKPACPQYIIYLRGPVAEAVPSIPSLYQHNSARGRTQIKVTGVRGDPNHPSCPDENRHWYVKGSGHATLHVLPSVDSTIVDEMKECDAADYEGPEAADGSV